MYTIRTLLGVESLDERQKSMFRKRSQTGMKSDTRERFYKMLLDKYADIINEKEQRTVGEIKNLINKEDPLVLDLLSQFKKENYLYDRDYLFVAQQVFEFITREIKFIPNDLNVNFWLLPKDILTNKVSDDEDLAVLLCTCLFTLGDEKATVYLMELEDLHTHAVVITTINDKTLLLDPSNPHGFFKYYDEKARVFKRYQFNGQKLKRALYRFNSEEYEQFF
jgi:hypothetical protein